MDLRDIKDRARRDLHQQARVEAFYYAPKSVLPRTVHVRVHNKWDAKGDVQGTAFNFAEIREETPKLVFWFEECDPDQKAVVVISDHEAYRVINPDPRYLQTVTAACTQLSEREIATGKFMWPKRGRAVAGAFELPFLTSPQPEPVLPPLTVTGSAMLFYVMYGDVELPGVV